MTIATKDEPFTDKQVMKTVMPPHVRILAHGSCLMAVVFLTFYAGAVCPFIDSLSVWQAGAGLAVVAVAQIIYRELLFKVSLTSGFGSLSKRHYFASIGSWILAGATASALHATLYTDFPLASHLKLLVGYWALGGGFAAMVESLHFSGRLRRLNLFRVSPTSFTGQFLRMFAIFTLVPGVVIVLIVLRFVDEGFINRGAALEMVFLVLVFAAVSVMVGYYFGIGLKNDAGNLVAALKKVEAGDMSIKIDDSRPDELGYVASQINQMSDSLQRKDRIQNAFGRFVNPHVAEQFIADIEHGGELTFKGARKSLAVMMCDLRGFSTLVEDMDPIDVTSFLNEYFSAMVEVIHKHDGVVDKFIGDAVMAVFGLIEADENKAVANAVAAAQEMVEVLERMNKKNKGSKRPELHNGIGLHYGEVVAGYIGSKERLEYTVIGSSVNLAARLEALARTPNPPLVFSDSVADVLRREGQAVTELGSTEVKGFQKAVKIFSLPVFADKKPKKATA